MIGADHRLEMTRLAIAGNPSFEVSSLELDRSGPSYSVDTVETFREEWGAESDIFFIMGIDAFVEIESWHEPDRLLRLCHFVVNSRPGHSSFAQVLTTLEETFGIAASGDSREITLPGGHLLYLIDVPALEISSTLIRNRIREGGSAKYLLPEKVESYILSHDIYG
jgi:nicotinate-nucleotide adenylyltransferase